jgi:hypothetical protein
MATKKKTVTAVPEVAAKKPQIPTMLAAVRRQLTTYLAQTEVLETKLAPVMRPGEVRSDGAKAALASAAPVAEVLAEYAGALAALNARMKDVLERLEV